MEWENSVVKLVCNFCLMNLPKKGDIKKPKQKQQEHTIINNLEETETIDLLSFRNKKNVEEKTDKLEELGIKQQKNYQKVLFICSGLENTITNLKKLVIQQNTSGIRENTVMTINICNTGFISFGFF